MVVAMKAMGSIVCLLLSITAYTQNIDEVLTRFYEATGGKKNWESLKGYTTTYNVHEKGADYVDNSTFEFPNRIRTTFRSKKGISFLYETDGKTAFEEVNGQRKVFEDQSLSDKIEQAFFLPFLYYKEFNLKIESLGLKRTPWVEGWNSTGSKNNCIAIQRNFSDGKFTIYYFDSVTGYLIQEINADGSYKTFLKYKDVNGSGFQLPTKIIAGGERFSRTYELISAEFSKGEKPRYELPHKVETVIPISASSPSSSYKKKLALVVGNSNYPNGGTLRNPVNDARAMEHSLKGLGFEVIEIENASLDQLKKAIDGFGRKLAEYEVGLFYYAGHGIQYSGSNYLIPVDADLKEEHQIEFDCLSTDRILRFMEAANNKVNIIILDACRNNPFERSWHRSANGRGLAFMNAPTGTLIAYATSPGSTADDGNRENGLYTESLLRNMTLPNLSIEQLFKRVRIEVEENSNHRQVPWESTSLKGEFCFTCTE